MRKEQPGAGAGKAMSDALLAPLTKREHEVLELMAFGLANKEIAARLSLSRRTVESHIDHVLGKLQVPTRARAVVEAGRAGLLDASGDQSEYGRSNNLPFQLTMLLGREQDVLDAKSLLESNRLVTLSGSGGVGKTRLALRLGIDLLDRYPDGVWLFEFASISDSALVARTVAKVLTIRERQNRPLVSSIVESLRRKQALLIFDNCEHVLNSAAKLVDEILHGSPNIRILATSRQALGIVGEVVDRVLSLSLPDSPDGLTADQSLLYGAIALFVDRAQSSDRRFQLTDENASVVAEICRRLDGIPLAIELAATRSDVLNVRTLARSLDDRFKMLTGGSRTALPRHKTLAALIDWSYDLLTPDERTLFNRVGVFAGGFDLPAASTVCGGDGLDATDILELLTSLTDKSLVVVDTAGGHERYRLLESTRVYALGKLTDAGDLDVTARRHAVYFRDQAQAMDERAGRGSIAKWLELAVIDVDNFRSALTWSLIGGHDAAIGGALAGDLDELWVEGGLTVEGREWIDRAQAVVSDSAFPAVSARLWIALAHLPGGELRLDCAQRASLLFGSVGDTRRAARARVQLASTLNHLGRFDDADAACSQALSVLRSLEDKSAMAACFDVQGTIQLNLGNLDAARVLYSQSLAAHKALEDETGTARVLGNLGELEFAAGDVRSAVRFAEEGLKIDARGKNKAMLAVKYCNSAAYHLALDEIDKAAVAARAGLDWSLRAQDSMLTTVVLQHLALVDARRGDFSRAARLLGYVNVQFAFLGLERGYTEKWGYDQLMLVLGEHFLETEMEAFVADSAAWSEDHAVEEALLP
jgi:predicted ATPase/DNA-binding CsgD family transcriptional regulator/predicted negative regulator of RcsB-dependent stress response